VKFLAGGGPKIRTVIWGETLLTLTIAERTMDERSIFHEALEKGTPEARAAFLNEVCTDDVKLRKRIQKLLSAHEDAGSFLERPPEEFDGTIGFDAGTSDTAADAWLELLEPSEIPDCLGTIGPYEVIELIGRGGMGLVVRAHDPKLKRTVAIKLLAPELATHPMSVRRFLREAQAAAAVSHDHVVTIHSINEKSRPPRIVMEYVDGRSLQQKIDQSGPLDVLSILRIGMQTAAGLAAAHRQGLIHRDIKPSNILLENGIERVKLTDFGLARAIDDVGVTRAGQIAGTPQYMSPEQAQGHLLDHRTDLFSFGCVMYAMCTGRSAFRADSAVAVMHSVVHDAPKPINDVNLEIPVWLCEIVDKLLEKNPDDRFQSADEVEDLIARHLAHIQQPQSARQPERLKRLDSSRLVKRPRASTELSLAVGKAEHQATVLLATIGVFDIVSCLTLFLGFAPRYRGSDIPDVLAISTVFGGVIGAILLLLTLFSRRFRVDGALQRQAGLSGGILALLPCGPVQFLAVPVSLWIVHVFWRSANRRATSNTESASKWPAIYIGIVALVLISLTLDENGSLVRSNWLNLTGRGSITVKVRDASVAVTVNGTPISVAPSGTAYAVVVPGVYVIRSMNDHETYLHEIQPGLQIAQRIGDNATEVAIIGPVSTEKLDQKARTELLKKYSQLEIPPDSSPSVQ
jgi:serine/threonine protein kinase